MDEARKILTEIGMKPVKDRVVKGLVNATAFDLAALKEKNKERLAAKKELLAALAGASPVQETKPDKLGHITSVLAPAKTAVGLGKGGWSYDPAPAVEPSAPKFSLTNAEIVKQITSLSNGKVTGQHRLSFTGGFEYQLKCSSCGDKYTLTDFYMEKYADQPNILPEPFREFCEKHRDPHGNKSALPSALDKLNDIYKDYAKHPSIDTFHPLHNWHKPKPKHSQQPQQTQQPKAPVIVVAPPAPTGRRFREDDDD